MIRFPAGHLTVADRRWRVEVLVELDGDAAGRLVFRYPLVKKALLLGGERLNVDTASVGHGNCLMS